MLEQHRKGATDGNRSIAVNATPKQGKRRGRQMRRRPSNFRSGNITREQIQDALAIDPNARIEVDSRGKGKMLIYRREV